MSDEFFKQKVQISFKEARKHMDFLENQVFELKTVISLQNDILKELIKKLKELGENPSFRTPIPFFEEINKKEDLQSLSKQLSIEINKNNKIASISQNIKDFNSSIGNEGVKHTLSTSIDNITTNEDISQNIKDFNSSIGNEGVKHTLSTHTLLEKQTIIQNKHERESSLLLKEKRFFDENFEIFKYKLNETFTKLTKQELRVFMTIYQFAEENKPLTYLELSSKLSLSENCIRSYVSSLVRKGLPLIKKKVNNKITYLSIEKDFQNLNLRHKLINLYYGVDPFQTSLFDIPQH